MSITTDAKHMAAIVDEMRTGETDADLGIVALESMANYLGLRLAHLSGSPIF